ncbi:YihY/virulence factor BrkB family protein [Arthrobacter sp. Hz1]
MARIKTRAITPAQIDYYNEPRPAELAHLKLKVIDARKELNKVRRRGTGGLPLLEATITYLLARFFVQRPVRVFHLYAVRRGPLMAAGIAYRLFFSMASLLLAGFSILGLVVAGNVPLQNLIVEAVNAAAPGILKMEPDGPGLATPAQLFNANDGLTLTLIVSTIITVITALGWIAGVRQAMRGIFALPPLAEHPVLIRIKDLGTLLVLGVAMVLTTVVGLVANTLLDVVFDWLDFGDTGRPLTQLAGIVIMLVLDFAVAVILFRRASGIEQSRWLLIQSSLITAVGGTVLRTFSTLLLASVGGGNPLLAPFTVVVGLFVWFFLLSQVYLLAAAWGAIGAADAEAGLAPRHGRSLKQRSRVASRSSSPR